MARSKYIWILFCTKYREVVGAFTVKHELASYIEKYDKLSDSDISSWEVWKTEDGVFQVPHGANRICSAKEFYE